ncbi:MAG: hypothetical protein IKB51_06795 [Clostridia bacterium]|nr:hypothetical protein [Clostridia bacterium]
MYSALKNQLKQHYDQLPRGGEKTPLLSKAIEIQTKIYGEMDEYYKHEKHPALLKSHIHTLIAENFEPKIFSESPFFYEMSLRDRFCWGTEDLTPSSWLRIRTRPTVYNEHPLVEFIEKHVLEYFQKSAGICSMPNSFDNDHHTIGYTTLFAEGIDGILSRVRDAMKVETNEDKYAFLKATEESCIALCSIAEKFSSKADEMLKEERAPQEIKFLSMIRDTAKRIPKAPPATFYEGLAMLLFTREALATLENIGISNLGHVDRLLGKLYEDDIAAGRLTESEARDLVTRWMMYTDIKFDLENSSWPETSTCIQLGGCDENGNTVYNSVTRIFIEEHHKAGFVNPKLNCRYSKNSPDEYLKLIGKALTAGHNNFVLINDDIVIPGLVNNGVALKDARRFVNGGCQETMIEGGGHTEGAGIYISIPRILDLFLRPDERFGWIHGIKEPKSFDEFYSEFFASLKSFLNTIFEQRKIRQVYHKVWQHCPLFSATQDGCIENRMDYCEGGASYNFSTVALVGLGTTVDSLYALKKLVYETGTVSLSKFKEILAADWQGYDELRREALSLTKYCQADGEVDKMANRLLSELSEFVGKAENERGGSHIPSLFVYYYFEYFSAPLRATPDGRRNGDLISMGCGPSRTFANSDITKPLRSMKNVDFTACKGGSAVLDVQLPLSKNLTPDIFVSLIRSCADLKCPTLQPNAVSPKELLDAKVNPDKHRDLIVRISGLSAYFTALTPQVQDEIIKRTVYNV